MVLLPERWEVFAYRARERLRLIRKNESRCDNGYSVGDVDATDGSEINCLSGSFCVSVVAPCFIADLQDTTFCCAYRSQPAS